MKDAGILSLCDNWKVAQYPIEFPDRVFPEKNSLDYIPATVPGAVQYDLLASGRLENPYASAQAAFDSAWVAKSDWFYSKTFSIDEMPAARRWFLRVNGVDTYSEVWLNGVLVGETRNNYRQYEFPLDSSLLRANDNQLDIRVKAHHRMVTEKLKDAACLGHDSDSIEGLMGKSLIRRYQRSFFTNSSLLNLGTGVLGIGINRPVELAWYGEVRITDWVFRTLSIEGVQARCELTIETDGPCAIRAVITNPQTAQEVAVLNGEAKDGELTLPISINNPKLWYPLGYGKPFLYLLRIELNCGGRCVQTVEKNIGIKTVELVRKLANGRNTFHFSVNGKRIYIRGQNTIPPDYIKVYGTPEENKRMFRLLENSRTNLLRVWGGGMPPEDSFLDVCDKLGIMLWTEGFLHSNVYPDYDDEFVGEYEEECRQMLKRARHHVSLCVICGGNEQIEGWEEYGWQEKIESFYGETLFTENLPSIAQELCPEILYVQNSPHGGVSCHSPVEGDSHNWGNYFNSFKDPLFVSETCWSQESYSRPETLEKYMGLRVDDFQGKGWIDRWTQITSRPRIGRLAYSGRQHGTNPSLRRYLHTLELEQAMADYNALRQFRLRSPSNSGIIYWSFNKGGPLFQFGCVDYGGYPLMSYYTVLRLNSAVAAGIFRDGEEIYIAVSNQSGDEFTGTAEMLHLYTDGRELGREQTDVFLSDRESRKVFSSSTLYQSVIDRTKEVFFLRLRDKRGKTIYEDILFLCPFGEFVQCETPVRASLKKKSSDTWELDIEAYCIIRQLEIESNMKILCTDNYFPMAPGEVKSVHVQILERTSENTPRLEIQTLDISNRIILILD